MASRWVAAGRRFGRRVLGLEADRAASDRAIGRLRAELRGLRRLAREQAARAEVQQLLMAEAALAARGPLPADAPLADAELRVFSQFGDDGILEHLLGHVGAVPERFVEFGVEDYREANTRMLLQRRNWVGLVMDADAENVEAIRRDRISWRHDLTAVRAFVDRENIDGLLRAHGFEGEIGLLSVDIDGMDYWVWDAITAVDPVLVVVEYNSVFGSRAAVTVPYQARFDRRDAHPSCLYFGASLAALCGLAAKKGYAFVGSNSAGVNAWFVRRARLGALPERAPAEGYVASRIRESRGEDGALTFRSGAARLEEIRELPLHDLERDRVVPIADLVAEGRL